MTNTLPPFRSLAFAFALVALGADAQSGPIAWGYGAISKGGAGGTGVGGYGSRWDADGAEDRHNVIANVWMPDTGGAQKRACNKGTNKCRQGWDCVWGATTKNDNEAKLKADGLHYADNVFSPTHNPQECVSTAKGQQPFSRPYSLPIHSTKTSSSMEQVLDAAGVQKRTARELQVVAKVRAALRARLP
jgi:hypothetical protein